MHRASVHSSPIKTASRDFRFGEALFAGRQTRRRSEIDAAHYNAVDRSAMEHCYIKSVIKRYIYPVFAQHIAQALQGIPGQGGSTVFILQPPLRPVRRLSTAAAIALAISR